MIAFLTNHAPFGGHEKFLHDEFRVWKRLYSDVCMIPINPKGHIIHRHVITSEKDYMAFRLRNPLVYLLGVLGFLRHPLNNTKLVKQILMSSGGTLNRIKNLVLLLKANFMLISGFGKNVEFIYALWASGAASFGYFLSILCSKPFGFVAHRGDIEERNMLKEKVERAIFVRTISVAAKRRLRELTGIWDDGKLQVIHLGVDVTGDSYHLQSKKTKKGKVIFFPALFFPVKGHVYALEALRLLVKERKDLRLVCAGDGPIFENIKRLAKQKGIMEYISFPGMLEWSRMEKLYEEADVVIMPSINDECGNHEGIPFSLMESMALGKPVISTRTGAIAELVENAGILVHEKDSVELAESIRQLLEHPDEAILIGRKGRLRVAEEFDVTKNVTAVYQLIQPYVNNK